MNKDRKLHGLEKICKMFGKMKCGDTMLVWDYENNIAIPESEMKPGTERWKKSEKAKWNEKD